MRKIVKRKIAAACVAAFMVLQCLPAAAAYADGPSQEVVLEKTAHWTDERAYEAEIDLTVKGMQSYTEKQKPVNIVPVLDVTASMNYCDTPRPYKTGDRTYTVRDGEQQGDLGRDQGDFAG